MFPHLRLQLFCRVVCKEQERRAKVLVQIRSARKGCERCPLITLRRHENHLSIASLNARSGEHSGNRPSADRGCEGENTLGQIEVRPAAAQLQLAHMVGMSRIKRKMFKRVCNLCAAWMRRHTG